MTRKLESKINCAKCKQKICPHLTPQQHPGICPSITEAELIKSMLKEYGKDDLTEFARIASILEGLSYYRTDWSEAPSPQTTRLEEIIRFATMMDYKRLGIAFCVGLSYEAELLIPVLENSGFEVVSICCKVGGIAKEEIGVKDSEKIHPGKYESMCNPIAQAEILNKERCEFNIMMGLCVGHDSLFLKYVDAPTTIFAVKDRLLGHNPLAALYQSNSYYRRLKSPDLAKRLVKDKPRKR